MFHLMLARISSTSVYIANVNRKPVNFLASGLTGALKLLKLQKILGQLDNLGFG